ncbi:PREDICTED: uncharacterized protein LOC106338080 [Brassica oleracea var. oleracea]|uniref:uncharacterized protein LOC106338080 n=1 Tax=Brassica oleracea var. oleracea TaxID=109376 RepID=UPI0006A6F83A|nr:PREDICTED: uncharacterized protein LOC106338080 [Brassica oleracea var. oleracea]
MKLDVLEKAYERVDPATSSLKTEVLRTNLTDLYKEYQDRTRGSSSGASFVPNPQDLVTESPLEDDLDNDLFELERSLGSNMGNTKTHLDVYLEEKRLDRKSFPDLDVLSYWRENQFRFGDLAVG